MGSRVFYRMTLFLRLLLFPLLCLAMPAPGMPVFLQESCIECHDTETKKGGLDLSALSAKYEDAETMSRWVKVHDRLRDQEESRRVT